MPRFLPQRLVLDFHSAWDALPPRFSWLISHHADLPTQMSPLQRSLPLSASPKDCDLYKLFCLVHSCHPALMGGHPVNITECISWLERNEEETWVEDLPEIVDNCVRSGNLMKIRNNERASTCVERWEILFYMYWIWDNGRDKTV